MVRYLLFIPLVFCSNNLFLLIVCKNMLHRCVRQVDLCVLVSFPFLKCAGKCTEQIDGNKNEGMANVYDFSGTRTSNTCAYAPLRTMQFAVFEAGNYTRTGKIVSSSLLGCHCDYVPLNP